MEFSCDCTWIIKLIIMMMMMVITKTHLVSSGRWAQVHSDLPDAMSQTLATFNHYVLS
jgi:hypothetical protein